MNRYAILGVAAAVVAIAALFAYNFSLNNTTSFDGKMDTTQNLVPFVEKFSMPVSVTSMSDEGPTHVPNIAIDQASNTMYVVYVDKKNTISNLYIKKSNDNGNTFSEPVRVNDKVGDVYLDGRVSPNVAIGPNGQVYVLWVASEPAPELFMKVLRSLKFAYSTDGGQSFSPAITIARNEPSSDKSFHALDVSSDGKIYVGWLESPVTRTLDDKIVPDDSRESAIRFARSLDGGNTFETSIMIDSNPCPCCNVDILADSDNSVYVSWRKIYQNASEDAKSTTIRDMVISHSIDGGQKFTNPTKISNDNFGFDGCVHVGAPMVMDSKGRIHAAWYTGKDNAPGIFYAISSDNTRSFSKPIPILTDTWVPPMRIQMTIDSNDNVWMTWEDATGLSAGEEVWRYDETFAMIYVAMISPDGEIIRSHVPLNQKDARSPVIASGKDYVSVLWASTDNEIQCASKSTKV